MFKTTDPLANGAQQAGARADEVLRDKTSQLHRFFDDVEELLHSVADSESAEIKRLRIRLESSIDQAKAATRQGLRTAMDGTRRAAKATDEYVHSNPWTAIGAGAAVGLVTGVLLRSAVRK